MEMLLEIPHRLELIGGLVIQIDLDILPVWGLIHPHVEIGAVGFPEGPAVNRGIRGLGTLKKRHGHGAFH